MEFSDEFVDSIKSTLQISRRCSSYTVGYPCYDEKEILACLTALLELRLSQGKYVKEFENSFLSYLSCADESYACAVNSGSSANLVLFAALLCSGKLNIGDKVVVPASTFATVASPLYQLGLIPVYVDVELSSYCMSSNNLLEALQSVDGIKACMVVHNLGFCEDIDVIQEVCVKNNILLIEDCCEAHGAQYKGKKLGTYGDFSTWSFFVAHNITTGEGGLIVSNSCEDESIVRSIREFGRRTDSSERFETPTSGALGKYDTRYIFDRIGYNVRMSDYAAAMGTVQLAKLDSLNSDRVENARRLASIFNNYSTYFTYCIPRDHLIPAYYGFPLLVKSDYDFRNEFCSYLSSSSIESRPNMGGCLPNQPAFFNQSHIVVGELPVSSLLTSNAFFLGVHSGLEESHFSLLESSLSQFMESIS